jgi:REP element-mobilizing transposase RayT
MVFDLSLHPGHKSLRMSYRDYAAAGIYFVTICTYDRRPTLAKIEKGTVHLSSIGTIVKERWLQIPSHHPQAALHAFVVMPNHFHGLLELTTHVDVPANAALIRREFGPNSVPSASLSAVVRSFKSGVTKHVRERLSVMSDIWQQNYFERVIRSGKEFDAATRYIIENPLKWEMDEENPEGVKTRRPR